MELVKDFRSNSGFAGESNWGISRTEAGGPV
jgi:hypothetical protein